MDIYLPVVGEGFRGTDSPLEVIANVVPIWNSLDCRTPSFSEIETSVSGNGRSRVQPLVVRSLPKGWKPWRISHVGTPEGDRIQIVGRNGKEVDPATGMEYHLAYASSEDLEPPRKRVAGEPELVLCLVLNPRAAEFFLVCQQ